METPHSWRALPATFPWSCTPHWGQRLIQSPRSIHISASTAAAWWSMSHIWHYHCKLCRSKGTWSYIYILPRMNTQFQLAWSCATKGTKCLHCPRGLDSLIAEGCRQAGMPTHGHMHAWPWSWIAAEQWCLRKGCHTEINTMMLDPKDIYNDLPKIASYPGYTQCHTKSWWWHLAVIMKIDGQWVPGNTFAVHWVSWC